MSSTTKSSILPAVFALAFAGGVCLLPVACEPGPPAPPQGVVDGGLLQESDGGSFADRPVCPENVRTCAGACSDGGSICLGNCGFLPPVRYPLPGNLMDLAAGDLQGDGNEDLVVANSQGDHLAVLLNQGAGRFQLPSLWRADAPTSVALAPIDGNSSVDVLFANSGDSTLALYGGSGTGVFSTLTSTSAATPPTASSLHDVVVWSESSGARRVAVINADTEAVTVHPVNADGSFGQGASYATPSGPTSLVVEDFNGDGLRDIAVSLSTACSGDNTSCQGVGLLLGQGDGSFAAMRVTQTGGTPRGIAAARVDIDAVMDLVVADSSNHQVLVLLGRLDGSFFLQTAYPTIRFPNRVVLTDINRDSVADLVVGSLGNELSVLLGQPGGTFSAQVPITASTVEVDVRAMVAADFDRDNTRDLAVLTPTGVQLLWGVCR
ncbi:MAG: VCBS repeat-containing protein [Cystobacter sp.]